MDLICPSGRSLAHLAYLAHSYAAQTPACHRTHLRTARRVWRIVVLATQTPSIRVLPGPHAKATCVNNSLSDWGSGPGDMPCADVVTSTASPATAINLIMCSSLFLRASFTTMLGFCIGAPHDCCSAGDPELDLDQSRRAAAVPVLR